MIVGAVAYYFMEEEEMCSASGGVCGRNREKPAFCAD